MASFANTTSPTPFGFFDNDSGFQTEADAMVVFVKRKLGDDFDVVTHRSVKDQKMKVRKLKPGSQRDIDRLTFSI